MFYKTEISVEVSSTVLEKLPLQRTLLYNLCFNQYFIINKKEAEDIAVKLNFSLDLNGDADCDTDTKVEDNDKQKIVDFMMDTKQIRDNYNTLAFLLDSDILAISQQEELLLNDITSIQCEFMKQLVKLTNICKNYNETLKKLSPASGASSAAIITNNKSVLQTRFSLFDLVLQSILNSQETVPKQNKFTNNFKYVMMAKYMALMPYQSAKLKMVGTGKQSKGQIPLSIKGKGIDVFNNFEQYYEQMNNGYIDTNQFVQDVQLDKYVRQLADSEQNFKHNSAIIRGLNCKMPPCQFVQRKVLHQDFKDGLLVKKLFTGYLWFDGQYANGPALISVEQVTPQRVILKKGSRVYNYQMSKIR